MGVQLLDKTRKINKLLHNNNSSKVVFNDICQVLTGVLDSDILVISKKGKVLGSSICKGVDELHELIVDEVGGYIDTELNERLLGILSTKENVNLETLGFGEDTMSDTEIIEKAKTLGMVEAKNISGTVADEYNSEKTDSSAANSDASSQKAETEQDSQMQDSQTAQEDTQQEAAQPAADAKQETVEPQDAVTTYTISVTSQDTCRTIAEKLKALNLVDDAEQFRIYMGQKGADHFIADGEHVIPQGASYDDIITILTQK